MSDIQNLNTPPMAPREEPLTFWEKVIAGTLLILFFCLSLGTLICYWPDKIQPTVSTTYCFEKFHVKLIIPAPEKTTQGTQTPAKITFEASLTVSKDTAKRKDSTNKNIAKKIDTVKIDPKLKTCAQKKETEYFCQKKREKADEYDDPCHGKRTIQLNSLLLILIAAAGFLGNMVHIATSFTVFVGADQFKRSWLLWYIVKPFTAAGLAIFIYFALNPDPSTATTINLNMIMAGAALAGLFTDKATQKLKDIFDAAFKTTDARPDKLAPVTKEMFVDMTKVKPAKMVMAAGNQFEIPGQNLNKDNLIITIDGIAVDAPVVTDTLIKFVYLVPADKAAQTSFNLTITDKNKKVLGQLEIPGQA